MRTIRNRAFTLVELMVVILIIGILVAILIPAIGAARQKAKETTVRSEFAALETGIEQFRGDSGVGGDYPPSRSDHLNAGTSLPDMKIANMENTSTPGSEPCDTEVTGAHLLAHAMVGADRLGPPGFKDADNDNTWSDDTHAFDGKDTAASGLYALDSVRQGGETKWARYAGGTGFVDENTRQKLRTLEDLEQSGTIAVMPGPLANDVNPTRRHPVFVDAWDVPILYYRANPSGRTMCGNASGQFRLGVYTQEDNWLITGTSGSKIFGSGNIEGIDFGAGKLQSDTSVRHALAKPGYPDVLPKGNQGDLDKEKFDDTFARFIWDKSVSARNEPVRKDTYLLISAGPDLVYGTADDITNWPRQD